MSYWSDNMKESIKEAQATLEYFFEVPLSLSDRMFLRKYVIESIDAFDEGNAETRMIVDPIYEAVGKFLMIHYDFRDIDKIAEICNGYTSDAVSRELREQRLFWNPAEI